MAKNEKGPITPKQQKVRKVFSIIANILGVIVVVITLFVSVLTITRTQKKEGLATLFGYAFMPVLTDSMSGTFEPGDLIITKEYKGDGSDLKVGDVITFIMYVNAEPVYNTHRIVEVHKDAYDDDEIGYYFSTRGDNNPDENLDGEPDVDPVTYAPVSIVATWNGAKLPGVGQVVTKLQTDPTFYFCVVVVPLIVLFVVYIFFFIRAIVMAKMQKTREEAAALAAQAAANAPVSLDTLSDDEKLKLLLELQAKNVAKTEGGGGSSNGDTEDEQLVKSKKSTTSKKASGVEKETSENDGVFADEKPIEKAPKAETSATNTASLPNGMSAEQYKQFLEWQAMMAASNSAPASASSKTDGGATSDGATDAVSSTDGKNDTADGDEKGTKPRKTTKKKAESPKE